MLMIVVMIKLDESFSLNISMRTVITTRIRVKIKIIAVIIMQVIKC